MSSDIQAPRPDEVGAAHHDRRTFLRRAAVGGAVAWAAPALISGPAGAQVGSCAPESHVWTPNTTVPNGSVFVDGTTTMTFAFAGGVGLSSTVDAVFARDLVGGAAQNYHMQLTGPQAGPEVITITFSPAISDVVFNVLDIDLAVGAWTDRVGVEAFLGATPVTVTSTPLGTGTTLTGTNQYTGNTPTTNANDDNSDVEFVVSGLFDTLVITYSRVGTLTSQGIGLSGFSWCAIP
jgi:hypothetical protein